MNSFLKRPVKIHKNPFKRFSFRLLILSAGIFVLAFPLMKGVWGSFMSGKPFSPKQIAIFSVSESPDKDAFGHTNILLVGIGGEGHSGENLTDTMMVASLDLKGENASILSIPRDLFVKSEKSIGWNTRINNIYDAVLDKTESKEQAMETLIGHIEEIVDVDIHYYAKIDFKGFVDVIDALGGIELEVKKSIYDSTYPAAQGYGYDPFSLEAGLQSLDGETALKYARSRHNTSDFDRALRQQEIIGAAKQKALSLGVVLNPTKLKSIYDAISTNFETDLEFAEIMYLAGKADSLQDSGIRSAVLSDDPTVMGGFLYPLERLLETDPYYIAPFDSSYEQIHSFTKLFFYHPELYAANFTIQVLNGTKVPNLAYYGMSHLERMGLDVVRFGNAAEKGALNTTVFTQNEEIKKKKEALNALTDAVLGDFLDAVPPNYSLEVWPTEADVIIELGEDFGDFFMEHPKWFY